jgi:hypothetical protein
MYSIPTDGSKVSEMAVEGGRCSCQVGQGESDEDYRLANLSLVRARPGEVTAVRSRR